MAKTFRRPKQLVAALHVITHRTVFLSVCLCFLQSRAQDNIRFQNLDINSGLSQSSALAITQDETGFIWIGTQDGLNRFDGFSFKVYRNESDNANTISSNFVQALATGEHGTLWVGTREGLNRYDAKTDRFERISIGEKGQPALSRAQSEIFALEPDGHGGVWVACLKGLYHLSADGVSSAYTIKDTKKALPGIRQMLLLDNQLWVSSNYGLYRVDKETKTLVRTTDLPEAWALTTDNQKRLWVGNSRGLYRITSSNGAHLLEKMELPANNQAFPGVRALKVDQNEQLWIGTNDDGLWSIDIAKPKVQLHKYRHKEYNPNSILSDQIFQIFEDRQGVIWMGTKNGASRFDRNRQGFIHINQEFDSENSVNDNTIWSFAEDGSGRVFIGTRKGITMWDRVAGKFLNFERQANNPFAPNDNSVLAIHIDKQGRKWVGYVDGFFLFSEIGNGDFKRIDLGKETAGFEDFRVYVIKEDRNENLWIGTNEGLAIYKKSSGEVTFCRNNPEKKKTLPSNMVRALHVDKAGNVWVGTYGGGLCKAVATKNGWSFATPESESENTLEDFRNVLSIAEDESGNIWLGTHGSGLIRYNPKSKSVQQFTAATHDIANDVIYGMLYDNEHNLWLSTNKGITKFNTRNLNVKNFSQKDGLQSYEFNVGAYYTLRSGEILFGGINGFNLFNPESVKANPVPPKMIITDMIMNNVTAKVDPSGLFPVALPYLDKVVLNHRENRFVIEFAAMHFSDPEGNVYKYRMEGVDADYTYVTGSERRISYNNLPPGQYRFVVYGANSDGKWSDDPAALEIIIEAPYWKRDWFQALMIFLVISIAGYGFLRQIREIRRQKQRLEQLVVERTREVTQQKEMIEEQTAQLKMEKDKVEKLLLNVLPEQTADELKSKGKAQARSYNRVSIMFTDFRNFTRLAEQFRPPDLVARLDDYFSKFDEIISKYQLEKIKTIGDAYMCAGGVPVRNAENPIYTVLAALEIQQFMREDRELRAETDTIPWELRIGINTGEVVAGVVGSKRFAYDVWGNAVNVAARMETASEPGKVNVSGKTFDFIEPFFECTYRGKIPAKNKGHIDMYFVERIKPELSVDGLGNEPSQAFWDYVNLHLYSSINYMKAERFIMKQLEKMLSPALHYHSIAHTRDVTKAVERIALMEGVRGEDLFLLQTAATYHDAGFVERYEANESIGVRMAREILPKYGYSDEQIDVVAGLIYATRVPHTPRSHLQEIICDADLDYLGRDDFHDIADKLRIELREHGKINSDRAWDEVQIKFLSAHRYFTKSAIKLRQSKKEKHIEDIKQRLATKEYAD